MSPVQGRGGIFISYRREETAGQAGRLYDRLSDHFGEGRVFMDVDSISIGLDFTKVLQDAVSGCEIMLVLIGQNWLDIADNEGRRRIDSPDDWIRIELETALQRDIRVVPVLVDGALLPQAGDLPASLQPLIHRQALALTHTGFSMEASRLVAAVDRVLGAESERIADAQKPAGTAEAPKADRARAAPKAAQRATVIQQGRWKLELLTKKVSKATFRLSSGQEIHTIAVNVGIGANLRVDAQRISGFGGAFYPGTEYAVPALSSKLGSDVTIKANDKRWQAYLFMSLTVKIGELILRYE